MDALKGAPVEDTHATVGWEVPREGLFVCRAHATRKQLDDEFGRSQVAPVTWARIGLGPFTCAVGPHDVEYPDVPEDPN